MILGVSYDLIGFYSPNHLLPYDLIGSWYVTDQFGASVLHDLIGFC
jgi:hypothetical protein